MNNVWIVALVLLIAGLLLGSIWYVPFRLSGLLSVDRAWPLYVIEVIIVVAALVSMATVSNSTSAIFDALANIAGVLFGFHIYAALSILVFDVLRRVIQLPDQPTAWAALSVALIFTALGAWQAGRFKVTETAIPIEGLDRDVKLMHISDVHIGSQRGAAYLDEIVDRTNQLQPEVVLINGDLVDANSGLEPGVLSALARFEAPAFFTTGNHESYIDTKRALEIIAGHGVRILRNEVVVVNGLQIVGLDYMNADENTFDMHAVNKHTIKEELPRIPIDPGRPVVLMHHSPVGLEYVSAQGIALMLSGHTHAGQIFPATLIARLLFPLNRGLHRRDGTYFFVSQGAGTYGPRMRLGSANEINLIQLVAGRK